MNQTIIFHMSGPPLRYLKKCGRNMEKYKRDNFAVLVNRLYILQFSSQLSILGGAGKRSCWGVLVIFERP